MTIRNDWRLTPSLDAFIVVGVDHKIIYLAAPEKKQYKNAVSKLIGSSSNEIHIDLNEFELKVELESQNPVIFIRNPEVLPDSDWYKVGNFGGNCYEFFLGLDSKKGEFPGHTFEAIFSESSPTIVSFSAPGMTNYKTYFEEMKRRINCEVKKKTKKWTPGHRYDTLKETYFYLGEVLSRKKDNKDTTFLKDSEMIPAYLYVNTLKDSETTISDVLNNRSFGSGEDDIKVMYSLPSGGDCGEVLSGDPISDFSQYWLILIKNAITKNSITEDFGYERVKNIKDIFDPLGYQSEGKLSYSLSDDSYKSEIKSVLNKVINDILICSWNIPLVRKDMTMLKDNTEEDNVSALEKNVYFYTEDENTSRCAYYSDLMKAIGIDMKEILTKSLVYWNEASLSEDFETYLKNSRYFDLRKNQAAITSRQRVSSTPYKLEVTTVESIFGTGELTETLKNMVTFAKENFGAGVTKYVLYNLGSKKQPKEYESIEISLKDVIKWCGGVTNVSEVLRSEIMRLQFTRAFIVIDKEKEVE
jgi:hypothetical protein